MRLTLATASVSLVAAAACTSDPRYLPAPTAIEVGVDTGDPTMPPATTATASMTLPIVPESFGLRGAVFADAATVFGNNIAADIPGLTVAGTSMDWRASVGAGLIWASPFGPLRFDFTRRGEKVGLLPTATTTCRRRASAERS